MRIIRFVDMKKLPVFRDLSVEELAEAYGFSQAALTAADLPMDELLRDLEEAQRQFDQRNP